MTYLVGTRGSALALKQTQMVIAKLAEAFPAETFEPAVIRTKGDDRTDVPLAAVGGDGLFVKELERALERGEVHLAVHSLKDLPTAEHEGLEVAAYLQRADDRDALVARSAMTLAELPDGAVIGTGSLRRRAQLAMINPTWTYSDVRGNLDTRLGKLDSGQFDAIILACAGLDRLGRHDRIAHRLPYSALLPAPGQGAIAVQCRAGDAAVVGILKTLDDAATRAAVIAERALLAAVGGGCLLPLGAHAEVVGDHLILHGVLASGDGRKVARGQMEGPMAKPAELGKALAAELLGGGGAEILEELRSQGIVAAE